MSPKPVPDQINMVVRDMDAAVAFYRRLGLDIPDYTPEWDAHHRSAQVGSGVDFDIDSVVFTRQWNEGWSGRKNGAGCVITFRVETRDEVDEVYNEMMAGGYKAQQAPYDAFWGARFAIIEDPDGNAVGVMSPADPGLRNSPNPPD
jgi:uncharacterized glyoxalase superfamily protein PhnB